MYMIVFLKSLNLFGVRQNQIYMSILNHKRAFMLVNGTLKVIYKYIHLLVYPSIYTFGINIFMISVRF